MIEPIEVQTIDISLKIKYYISYLYLFLIIYLLIFSYNNKFLNIYFKGYIHGNLYYINKDFSLKNILKYKPYFILLGIIDYYSSFNIKFISLKEPNTLRENVISFSNQLPKEFKLHQYIDYDEMFTKSFLEPLRFIVNAIGWNFERKATLDEFF